MRRSLHLVLFLGVAACAAKGAPAPIEFRTHGAAPQAPSEETVAPGEAYGSEPDWAAGPGTPLSVWALRPEEAHPFDPLNRPSRHVVERGETLYSISARYQAPLAALVSRNNLAAPFALRAGQTLDIPPPRTHVVAPGETLLALARRYSIDPRSLALMNRLTAPYTIRVGQKIALPALARAAPEIAAPEIATPEVAALSRPAPPLPPPKAGRAAGAPVTNARPTQPSRPSATILAASPAPSAAAGGVRFDWPLRGRLAAAFGAQEGKKRSDGVDIEAPAGSAILAAEGGRVVYAGEDLPGYGKLLLIQHAGGWVTAYARCGAFAVEEGAEVHKGQKIAETGEARMHFQVRRGATPTDPVTVLPPI